jgi:hypothetical protein
VIQFFFFFIYLNNCNKVWTTQLHLTAKIKQLSYNNWLQILQLIYCSFYHYCKKKHIATKIFCVKLYFQMSRSNDFTPHRQGIWQILAHLGAVRWWWFKHENVVNGYCGWDVLLSCTSHDSSVRSWAIAWSLKANHQIPKGLTIIRVLMVGGNDRLGARVYTQAKRVHAFL